VAGGVWLPESTPGGAGVQSAGELPQLPVIDSATASYYRKQQCHHHHHHDTSENIQASKE